MNSTVTKIFTEKNGVENSDHFSTLKYQIFSCLWALATLFHMANKRAFAADFLAAVLTIAAILVLLKPSSVLRMMVLIALQVFEVMKSMPGVSNHWFFTTFVNLTLIFVLIYLAIRNSSFKIDKAELYQTFAPLVRLELIILYFFVVFHKLNSAFFFSDVSCASELLTYQNTFSLIPKTQFFMELAIWFTILVEALIPILLCFRKTRTIGVFVGLIFHAILALNQYNGFYDFSSMVYAVYVLFLGDIFASKIRVLYLKFLELKAELNEKIKTSFSVGRLLLIMGIFLFGLIAFYQLIIIVEDFFRHIFWIVYSLAFLLTVGYVIYLERDHHKKRKSFFKVAHWGFYLIPAVLFINGCSPYLGLKTEYSFSMFSNLKTEGGISNHYIIPASFQIFDYQKELIEILGSSDELLQRLADAQQLMVYSEFKDIVWKRRPQTLTYIRNGKVENFNLEKAEASGSELLQSHPFLYRKFFRFRSISKESPQQCSH